MTSLQKEVSRRLPELNCTSRYDERSGRLNIDYEGTELLSLHKNKIVFFREENHQPEERLAQYYKVNDLIHKAAEYVRAYDAAPPMEAEGVREFRRLASYNNGIVMAGREDKYHGYMFTTWIESDDRKHVEVGDYSPDYEYVKESFITRSGLIDKVRVFSDEQLRKLYSCLCYTAENNESLTYGQERNLKEMMWQIANAVPDIHAAESPSNASQQNM